MGDQYRPSYHREPSPSSYNRYDRHHGQEPRPLPPSPPLPHPYQPAPPGMRGNYDSYVPLPRAPSGMFRFGQHQGTGPGNSFSFSHTDPPPLYPGSLSSSNYYRSNENDPAARRRQKARNRGDYGQSNGYQRRDRHYKKAGASERALLHFERGNTPPQLKGMNNETEAGAKYLDFDELSDMEEQDMEESEDEDEEKQPSPPPLPKWSNPETYTALPPPDESQRKRKDFVKLIRKARVAAHEDAKDPAKNAVAAGDDFISLDMGDDNEELIKPAAPAGAPRGPAADRIAEPNVKSVALKALAEVSAQPHVAAAKLEVVEVDDSVGAKLTSLKRKRSLHDDEVEEIERRIRPPSKSLRIGPAPSGTLLRDWIPDDHYQALPWLQKRHGPLALPNVRLHQEIVDFYRFVSPKKYEHAVRKDLLTRLQTFMNTVSPGCEVHNFGSFAAGLYLPDADIDVAVLSRDYAKGGYPTLCRSSSKMHKLAVHLKQSGFADDTEVIAHSKVPIIKFVDKRTQLKVDVCFENTSGINANQTFEIWKAQFPAMPILVMVIKQFLLMRGLNDVANGGIGGFSITCLITSLLQNMPRVQSGELKPEQHLGEMLLEFLDFYGNRFDLYRTTIRMNPPGYESKDAIMRSGRIRKADSSRLMILDPNMHDNDISGGSRLIGMIFDKFQATHRNILAAMFPQSNKPRTSLLDFMLGGNYDSFLWYRRHLKKVYEEQWGPVPAEDP